MEIFKNMHLFVEVAKASSFRRAGDVLEMPQVPDRYQLRFWRRVALHQFRLGGGHSHQIPELQKLHHEIQIDDGFR